jgi:hypothetical protein
VTAAPTTYRNPKGHVLGAPWTLLAPSGIPGRVLVLGRPSAPAREALARFAPVEVRQVGRTGDLPGRSMAVVAVLGRAARRFRREPTAAREVARLLEPGGVAYVDGPATDVLGGAALELAVSPVVGEPRTLVPARDDAARRLLVRHQLWSPIVSPERLERPARRLMRGRLARFGWRRAALLAPDGRSLADAPAWLRAMAAAEGVELEGLCWGLSAAGRYRSRKVVFFLLDEGADVPRFVVKLPRHPDEGARLEREAAALDAVRTSGVGTGVVVPRRAFLGYVGRSRLPVLGQTGVDGIPFRSAMTREPGDHLLEQLVSWAIQLAVATAGPAAPGEVAPRLKATLEDFLARCGPSAEEADALASAVEALAAAPQLPLVLEHGDLGVWNILVAPDGSPVVLDWEAGEPRGMPLWDLLYLVRSYAASSAGTGRGRLAAVYDLVEGRSAFSPVLRASVARAAAAVQLDEALVRPLFLSCWMHRAVKEVSRRPNGPYRRLVRRCLERPEALCLGTPVHEGTGR